MKNSLQLPVHQLRSVTLSPPLEFGMFQQAPEHHLLEVSNKKEVAIEHDQDSKRTLKGWDRINYSTLKFYNMH